MNVRPVIVAIFQTVPVPESVNVPEPIVMVRVFTFVDANVVKEWFRLLKSTVPLVSWNVLLDVIASWNVRVSLIKSVLKAHKRVLVADVNVFDAPFVLKFNPPVNRLVIHDTSVILE